MQNVFILRDNLQSSCQILHCLFSIRFSLLIERLKFFNGSFFHFERMNFWRIFVNNWCFIFYWTLLNCFLWKRKTWIVCALSANNLRSFVINILIISLNHFYFILNPKLRLYKYLLNIGIVNHFLNIYLTFLWKRERGRERASKEGYDQ